MGRNRLNIFIDETGEFGFKKGSAKIYGVSLVFHEQKDNIVKDIKLLKEQCGYLNFDKMLHMGDLVNGHSDFEGMSVSERRKIYSYFFRFSTRIHAKYYTIIIEKKHSNKTLTLEKSILEQLNECILAQLDYFQSFDEIVVYYDGGQVKLSQIINKAFSIFPSFIRKSDFDHVEKKLFQVADMLTYLDKLIYRFKNGNKLTRTEAHFFDPKSLKNAEQGLKKHRFRNK